MGTNSRKMLLRVIDLFATLKHHRNGDHLPTRELDKYEAGWGEGWDGVDTQRNL